MSELTIASKTLPLIDVPEPTNYNVSFLYFGYDITEAITARAGTMQVDVTFDRIKNTSEFGNIGGSVPVLSAEGLDEAGDWKDLVVGALEGGNFLDESVMPENFANIVLQDYFVAEKAVNLVDASAKGINVDLENLASSDGAGAILAAVTGDELTIGTSISDEMLTAVLQQKEFLESLEPTGVVPGTTIWGAMAGIQHINTIDSLVIQDVARATTKNVFGTFSGNMSYLVPTLESFQATAIEDSIPGELATNSWEYAIEPIGSHAAQMYKWGEAIVVGYLIEKIELTETGEAGNTSIFFIAQEEADVGTVHFEDDNVKIATTYSYGVSTVVAARIPSIPSIEDGSLNDVDIIIKSRVQTMAITTGIGYPPPPTDITFVYDAAGNKLHFTWDFGLDDVSTTKFQIFRRDNVNQPFSLIRQYDFSAGIVGDPGYAFEDVDFGLDVRLNQPMFYYIDEEFVEGREYIYALCSINLEGASSPFSNQYAVKYNRTTGRLDVRQLSVSGAPKPYPNFYLEQDLTKNVGKVSDVSSLNLYFTPEVYNVTKNTFDEVTGDAEDTVFLEFLKESGPLTNTGKYFLEVTELGTFQQAIASIALASDDVEDLITGERIQGLILDPTSV